MERFFKLKEHSTTISTEIMAGLTTFFAMSYILIVNPSILSATGMPFQAVFLATIISSAISTLVMGLFANVPYALAPGMGLNAFFTYTVVFSLGFSWQEALAMVFLCGIFNILITVTKIRKLIIKSIPESLQNAIGAGIGVFIGYIGLKNAGFLTFLSDSGTILSVNNTSFNAEQAVNAPVFSVVTGGGIVPELTKFTSPMTLIALFGLILTIILLIKNVKGAILIGIISTTLLSIMLGYVKVGNIDFFGGVSSSFNDLGKTFGAALGQEGLLKLFSDTSKLPTVLLTIFAFSLSDVFDTIGTFIGTGRKTGIFSLEDEKALEQGSGFSSKMDKALFADAIGTSIGAVIGTSNTTTYVESAAGIGSGGRTGLTSVVTAIMFILSILLAPVVNLVPAQATAPALILVGIMMLSAMSDIKWTNLEEAIPAFFASIFMGMVYSISNGIAAGFILYVIIKVVKGKAKEIHPIIWFTTALFLLNFIILATIK